MLIILLLPTIYPSFFGVRLCQEYVMLCADHYLYHISLKSYFLMGLYFKALMYYCSDNSEATSNEAGIHTTSLTTYGTTVYIHVQCTLYLYQLYCAVRFGVWCDVVAFQEHWDSKCDEI